MAVILETLNNDQMNVFCDKSVQIGKLADQSTFQSWSFVSTTDKHRPISHIPLVCAERMVAVSRSLRDAGFHNTTHRPLVTGRPRFRAPDLHRSFDDVAYRILGLMNSLSPQQYDNRQEFMAAKDPFVKALVSIADEMRGHGHRERGITWLAIASQNAGKDSAYEPRILEDYKQCLTAIAGSDKFKAIRIAVEDAGSASTMGDWLRENAACQFVQGQISEISHGDAEQKLRAQYALKRYIDGSSRFADGGILSIPMREVVRSGCAALRTSTAGTAALTVG